MDPGKSGNCPGLELTVPQGNPGRAATTSSMDLGTSGNCLTPPASSTTSAPTGILHGGAGVDEASEPDGFDEPSGNLDAFTAEVLDRTGGLDAGSPNLLGWAGNFYAEDPQYSVYADDLTEAAGSIDLRKVFVAILGDAGSEVRAPRPDCLTGAWSTPSSTRRPT